MMLVCLVTLTSYHSFVKAQENTKYSLIVIHYDPASKANFKQLVYAYHFLNGTYTGREELMSFMGRVNNQDYVRTDKGNNFIYQNRYMITGAGSIVDLKEKKILFDQRVKLVKCSNDSVIYYTNDAFKGKFYSVYNLKTKTYGEVKALLFKAKAGQDVEFDKGASPFTLNYYPQSKPKITLTTDAGFGQKIPGESKKPDPALHWLDNNEFVFCKFNNENTAVEFIKVNVNSKAQTSLGTATIKSQGEEGTFTVVNKSQLQYNFGSKKFLIDIDKKTTSELLYTLPENGFSVECKTNSYGHIIKLNDKDIGKYHFQLKNIKTEKNIAGIVKELIVGTDSYQQGMSVWNNTKQAWVPVDCEDVVAIIGWIKEN